MRTSQTNCIYSTLNRTVVISNNEVCWRSRNAVGSICAAAKQHDGNRCEEDLNIKKDRLILDVAQIEHYHLLHTDLPFARDR